ncbi:MAG TPA: GNAT family N-acetyltransferase [Candidatus Binatia bacterium]|nr:GNAT family N-acetyltransferase [Candidatus Binatia bacterium]
MSPNRINLETKRLLLRPFALSDAPAVQRLAGAREVADTTLLIPHPYPDGVAEQFINGAREQFEKGEQCVFAITLRSTAELCGSIGLKISPQHERGELGYWIGVPFWKQGYCTEVGEAVLRFAFEELRLNCVNAHHFVRNAASGRVLQKLGMRYDGRLRQHVRKWDHFEDLDCYSILRSEWVSKSATVSRGG